jgi:hypothetical protein
MRGPTCTFWANLTQSWLQLNVTATSMTVRDLWGQKDVGTFHGKFTAKAVPPHGVAVLTIQAA